MTESLKTEPQIHETIVSVNGTKIILVYNSIPRSEISEIRGFMRQFQEFREKMISDGRLAHFVTSVLSQQYG